MKSPVNPRAKPSEPFALVVMHGLSIAHGRDLAAYFGIRSLPQWTLEGLEWRRDLVVEACLSKRSAAGFYHAFVFLYNTLKLIYAREGCRPLLTKPVRQKFVPGCVPLIDCLIPTTPERLALSSQLVNTA